jgi:hypothetical protein
MKCIINILYSGARIRYVFKIHVNKLLNFRAKTKRNFENQLYHNRSINFQNYLQFIN